VAVPVVAVGPGEGHEVELVDHVQDEPDQVVGGQPFTHVGWEQQRLVAVAGKEVVGHGRSYAMACSASRSTRTDANTRRLAHRPGPAGGAGSI
jgi:hypothetical protein